MGDAENGNNNRGWEPWEEKNLGSSTRLEASFLPGAAVVMRSTLQQLGKRTDLSRFLEMTVLNLLAQNRIRFPARQRRTVHPRTLL